MRRAFGWRWGMVAAAVVGLAAVPRSPATSASSRPPLQLRLGQALLQGRARAFAPGVLAGVWMPGLPSWVARIGTSDRRTGSPMRPDLHVRVGSVTKTITVTALLLLVQDGLVSLDDPVSAYVDGVPRGDEITLRMLANMTSGLFNYTHDPDFQQRLFSNPEAPFTPEELLAYSFSHDEDFDPGAGWDYCNTNTVLLGLAIEQASGLPLGEFFRQRIFEPAGMRQSFFLESSDNPVPFAHGYTRQTLDGRLADAAFWTPTWGWAAGNVSSTLDDVRILARLVATGQPLISPQLQQERLTWVTLPPNTPNHKYGLGVGSDHGWIGHTGELPGYNTVMFYYPPRQITLVVMVNSDVGSETQNPAPTIARELARVLTPNNLPFQTDDDA